MSTSSTTKKAGKLNFKGVIRDLKFKKKAIGGLDPVEVYKTLHSIAEEYDFLYHERNDYKRAVKVLEMENQEYIEKDNLLKNTIATATRMTDQMRSDAEKDARLILHEAQLRAETTITDAKKTLQEIYNEVNELKKIRNTFENNIQALIQSHLTMLDESKKILPTPEVFEPHHLKGLNTPLSMQMVHDDLMGKKQQNNTNASNENSPTQSKEHAEQESRNENLHNTNVPQETQLIQETKTMISEEAQQILSSEEQPVVYGDQAQPITENTVSTDPSSEDIRANSQRNKYFEL